MPRHTPYALRWSPQTQSYEIFSQTGSVLWTSVPDGSTWLTWLESISSFAFYSRSGAHCTVRKETIQQHGAYWYSYRSLQGRTTKRYLGRTGNISLERLEAVAESFLHASSVRATVPESPPVSSDASTFSASLVTSRLYPPRLPPVLLRRQQLLDRFATWRSYKLTLLMAPAGFGKTTLVNSWLAERQRSDSAEQIAWITLAPDDNNPLYFWRTLIVACQTWEPHLGEKALIQLPSTLQPLFKSVSLETILIQLLNDLARQEKESILVLDDYHLIEEPQIHAAMSFFLEHLPGNLHIVIATRSEPPLPLVRWRAQGVVQEMHASHLRFSLEETSEFLKQTFARQLSSTSLQELHTFLNGWAAGLRLLTFTLQEYSEQEIERALLTFGKHTGGTLPQKPLLDYLVAEILQQQPEYLQRFLLQTGGFERLNASFCNALTGREDSATLLETIGKANLFLEEVDGEVDGPDLEYRYHTVFAEALRREANIRLSTEQMYDLARRASRWYEQEAR
ncbi:MAG TPA: hypothetical protein VFN35_11475, partial [Ktedonobacteraceae bacterium]|nr:hypothetical protein [Ktedonobacteraceae bacterium]